SPQRCGKQTERRKIAEGAGGPNLINGKRADSARVIGDPTLWSPRCGCRDLRLAPDLEQLIGEDLTHVGARSHVAFDIAFRLELLEGIHNRSPRQPVLLAQIPRARKSGPGAQPPLENFAAQRVV